MRNIAIFCASSNLIPEKYKQHALDFANELAKYDVNLIYGGGKVGIMGIVGDVFIQNKKTKTGVIPGILHSVEVAATDDTEQIVTKTMQERKHILVEKADAFIILPGGIGTLDEFFEVLTMKQIGALGDKPIVLVNWFGFFDSLLEQLNKMNELKFTHFDSDWFSVFDNNRDIINAVL
jgi:uncharacterized protein (TIGR00730 family)